MPRASNSAVVISVDRLGAGFLGPYGNTWLDTPWVNRLASQSFLLENHLSDSPQLDVVNRSYWQGAHAMCGEANRARQSLAQVLSDNGIASTLITDAEEVAEHDGGEAFAESICVTADGPNCTADDIEHTQLARLVATVIDRLHEVTAPSLLWIHARGMDGAWDAPLEFRNQFADEEDPEPPDFVEPPSRVLNANYDPDELLGIVHAYAGQVSLLDACLGGLLNALADSEFGREALLIFTSPRGFPLGEHRRVGSADERLYGELLHTPLLLRFPDAAAATARSHALTQPADLFPTLLDWFDILDEAHTGRALSLLPFARGQCNATRDRVCSIFGPQRAIRTPAWFLRESPSQRELYAKPDDRCEVNEVADRCPEVTDELVKLLDEFHQFAQTGQPTDLSPLTYELLHGID